MQYYFAPLEGLTGHIYRNVHHRHFPGMDRYYMPFIVPNESGSLKKKDREDLLPENNTGIRLIPQLLSNHAGETVKMIRVLSEEYGYREINLNLGCPMPAITRKHRGSGLLAWPEELEAFLDGVFTQMADSRIRISVKTRLGMYSIREADRLIRIYDRFPISELIVHPRCGRDLYRGRADREVFGQVLRISRIPVIYNGDIFTSEDARQVCRLYAEHADSCREHGQEYGKDCRAMMIGRGLLRNPSLVRQLQGGIPMTGEEFRDFHEDLYQGLSCSLPRKKVLLGLMKGYWYYWKTIFPDQQAVQEAGMGKIFQADTAAAYEEAVRGVLAGMQGQDFAIMHNYGMIGVRQK